MPHYGFNLQSLKSFELVAVNNISETVGIIGLWPELRDAACRVQLARGQVLFVLYNI